MKLDGSGLDLVGLEPEICVSQLLSSIAPRFVKLISTHPILKLLPLYKAYGDAWLQIIELRARTQCVSDMASYDEFSGAQLELAKAEISRIQNRGAAT